MLIEQRLQMLMEKEDSLVVRILFDAYGRMNEDQCFAVIESPRLVHEYRHFNSVPAGRPAHRVGVVGTGRTEKIVRLLFTLSVLYRDENVGCIA